MLTIPCEMAGAGGRGGGGGGDACFCATFAAASHVSSACAFCVASGTRVIFVSLERIAVMWSVPWVIVQAPSAGAHRAYTICA